MADFLILALLGGLGVAAIAGPLGSFVVWRRMAYFGDTLAHSALLGVSLGFLFDINLNVAVIACCVILALTLVTLQRQHLVATDTLLGIMAHSSLSLGLVAIALIDDIRVDLMAYLFGDLLAINEGHVYWLLGSTAITLTLVLCFWNSLLAVTVSPELAKIEGRPVMLLDLMLILLLAMTVALAMKVVGILLISALLIMPPAAAHALSKGPRQMAAIASVVGIMSVLFGMWASFRWDTPAGPSIVVTAMLLFIASLTFRRKR